MPEIFPGPQVPAQASPPWGSQAFSSLLFVSWPAVREIALKQYILQAIQLVKHLFLEIQLAMYYKKVMEKKAVTFRLAPALIKRMKFLALEKDKNVTELLTEAIHDYLKKHEKKPRV